MDMNPESRYVFSEVCSFYSQIFKKLMIDGSTRIRSENG